MLSRERLIKNNITQKVLARFGTLQKVELWLRKFDDVTGVAKTNILR